MKKKIYKLLTDSEFKKDLQSYGVEHLWLFGSYAVGDDTKKERCGFTLYMENPLYS